MARGKPAKTPTQLEDRRVTTSNMPLRHRAAKPPSMMFCGKHVRPMHTSKEPRQYDISISNIKPEQRYRRKLLPGEKRGDCICDYNDFCILRWEREGTEDTEGTEGTCKNIKNDTTTKKASRFLALPAEIRNQIYEELFITKGAIEFCHDPFIFTGTKPGRFSTWDGHYYEHENFPLLGGGLLRVNKQICKEATAILYSRNEFRFSNCTGWIALDRWLHQIGLKKADMLRYITVCHPNFTKPPQTQGAEGLFDNGSFIRDNGPAPGFDTYREKRWFEDSLSRDPSLVLEKAGKLEHLRVVIPCLQNPSGRFRPVVDVNCFQNLNITVARLIFAKAELDSPRGYDKAMGAAQDVVDWHLQHTGETWLAETHVVSKTGGYPMIAGLRVDGEDNEDQDGEENAGDEQDQDEQDQDEQDPDEQDRDENNTTADEGTNETEGGNEVTEETENVDETAAAETTEGGAWGDEVLW